jgi:peptidoglycan/xylan/chitin deacetylase (PgdA/CDA1 family)
MDGRLRRFLHYLVADLAHYSGLLRLRSFYRRRILGKQEVYILCLHRVLTEEEQNRSDSVNAMVLGERTFVKMLEYISRRYRIVSFDAFLANGANSADLSRPWCLVTFDDGWRDNYTTAYPWLKKFHLPALVFLTTGLIESQELFWIERLARAWKHPSRRAEIQSRLGSLTQTKDQLSDVETTIEYLKRMPSKKRQQILDLLMPSEESYDQRDMVDQMLTWGQVTEMSRDGIEFGSHTVTHPLLTFEDDAVVNHELCASKQILEEKLDKKVRAFAYPNGDCDQRVRRQVRQAGYECAFTTRPGWYRSEHDLFDIRRIQLHEGNVTGPRRQFSPAMFSFMLARWS